MSKLRSPRLDCSMTIGTSCETISWWSITGDESSLVGFAYIGAKRERFKPEDRQERAARHPGPPLFAASGSNRLAHLVRQPDVTELAGDVVGRRVEIVQAARHARRRIGVEQIVDAERQLHSLVEDRREIIELDVAVEPAVQLVRKPGVGIDLRH